MSKNYKVGFKLNTDRNTMDVYVDNKYLISYNGEHLDFINGTINNSTVLQDLLDKVYMAGQAKQVEDNTMSNWIDVDETLPPGGQLYYVLTLEYGEVRGFFYNTDLTWGCRGTVTHWRKIPKDEL